MNYSTFRQSLSGETVPLSHFDVKCIFELIFFIGNQQCSVLFLLKPDKILLFGKRKEKFAYESNFKLLTTHFIRPLFEDCFHCIKHYVSAKFRDDSEIQLLNI
jgi:hypothetical protein